MPKRLRTFWQSHFLGVEAFSGLLVAIAFAFCLGMVDGVEEQVNELLKTNQQAVFGRVATIAGTLMGFGIAVAAFIMPTVMSSERFRLLRSNNQFNDLWRTYSQVVKCFGLLTVSSLVCLVLDASSTPFLWSLVPLVFFLSLSVLRMLRAIWLLERIIGIVLASNPRLSVD